MKLTGQLQGIAQLADLAVDGEFGKETAAVVVAVEKHYGLAVDAGVAGQQVWSVLLTGAA